MSFLTSDMEAIAGALSSYTDFISDYTDLLLGEVRDEIGDDELSRLLLSICVANLNR